MAIDLPPRTKGGKPPVVRDHDNGGAYLIDSSEYLSATELKPNSLFDDPEQLADLLRDTRISIEGPDADPRAET
jgi:hypothetical protein